MTELCTFGPIDERRPVYILRFEDPDMGEMVFDDRDEALKAFDLHSPNWNCTLFGTVSRHAGETPFVGLPSADQMPSGRLI